MHGSTSMRKGHVYKRYSCANKCGFGIVRMEDVDSVVVSYLRELLTKDNQLKIADSLREIMAETPQQRQHTVEEITAWLDLLKATADKEAVRLLIWRIDVLSKADFCITSTLTPDIVGELYSKELTCERRF